MADPPAPQGEADRVPSSGGVSRVAKGADCKSAASWLRRFESFLPHQFCLPTSFARKASETRSEEHTSELQSRGHLVCPPFLEKKMQFLRHRLRTWRGPPRTTVGPTGPGKFATQVILRH